MFSKSHSRNLGKNTSNYRFLIYSVPDKKLPAFLSENTMIIDLYKILLFRLKVFKIDINYCL